jgi:hypothetical protein
MPICHDAFDYTGPIPGRSNTPVGRLLVLTDGTTVYYYGLDGHGSVVNLTDRSGVVQDSYRYDPYGNS